MGPRGTESIRERRMFNRYFIIPSMFVANPNEVFTLNVRLAFYVVNSSKFHPCLVHVNQLWKQILSKREDTAWLLHFSY